MIKAGLFTTSLLLGTLLLNQCAPKVGTKTPEPTRPTPNTDRETLSTPYNYNSKEDLQNGLDYIIEEMNKPGAKALHLKRNSKIVLLGTNEVDPNYIVQRFTPLLDRLFSYFDSEPTIPELEMSFAPPKDHTYLFINRITGHFFDHQGEVTFKTSTDQQLSVINLPITSPELLDIIKSVLGDIPNIDFLSDQIENDWGVAQAACLGNSVAPDLSNDAACNVFSVNVALASSGIGRETASRILELLGTTKLSEKGIEQTEMKYQLISSVYDAFEIEK
jgi:hypothetical protein